MKQPQTITISAILILNTIFRSIVFPLRCTHFANCWIFKSGQPQKCMTMQMYAKHYRTHCKCIRTIIIHVFSYIMHFSSFVSQVGAGHRTNDSFKKCKPHSKREIGHNSYAQSANRLHAYAQIMALTNRIQKDHIMREKNRCSEMNAMRLCNTRN